MCLCLYIFCFCFTFHLMSFVGLLWCAHTKCIHRVSPAPGNNVFHFMIKARKESTCAAICWCFFIIIMSFSTVTKWAETKLKFQILKSESWEFCEICSRCLHYIAVYCIPVIYSHSYMNALPKIENENEIRNHRALCNLVVVLISSTLKMYIRQKKTKYYTFSIEMIAF